MGLGLAGWPFRMVRIRAGLTQAELGRRAGVSQGTISRVERGQLAGVRVATLRAIGAVLGIVVDLRPRWRGGELDRLLAAGHAQLHDELARHLSEHGWLHDAEVTFSVFGERGAIDILAWHPRQRVVLVVELNTEVVDVHELLASLDRKRRLAPGVARERGWDPVTVGAWVVIAEDHTNRRRVAAHRHVLRTAFPADGADHARVAEWPGQRGLRSLVLALPDAHSGPPRRRPGSPRAPAPGVTCRHGAPVAGTVHRVVRKHRRFSLRDVTLEGRAVGGATVDAWLDDDGNEQWAARAMVPLADAPTDGMLAGTTRDGRRLTGHVRIGMNRVGAKGARVVLVDLYGSGPLTDESGDRHGG